ncbi:MAG: hypothetical protein RML39_05355 [Oscillatoriaceae cyanobacterium SKYGB_i_bin93]|nr:hypothetical protein [Oscillatoriaceae cyanobacterium SKYGB_i_bin93]
MFIILLIVIALVAWSLHLMQEAIKNKEFALMLAGTLVATAAAAMVAVYFLMGAYVGYVTEMTQQSYIPPNLNTDEYLNWVSQWDGREKSAHLLIAPEISSVQVYPVESQPSPQ